MTVQDGFRADAARPTRNSGRAAARGHGGWSARLVEDVVHLGDDFNHRGILLHAGMESIKPQIDSNTSSKEVNIILLLLSGHRARRRTSTARASVPGYGLSILSAFRPLDLAYITQTAQSSFLALESQTGDPQSRSWRSPAGLSAMRRGSAGHRPIRPAHADRGGVAQSPSIPEEWTAEHRPGRAGGIRPRGLKHSAPRPARAGTGAGPGTGRSAACVTKAEAPCQAKRGAACQENRGAVRLDNRDGG